MGDENITGKPFLFLSIQNPDKTIYEQTRDILEQPAFNSVNPEDVERTYNPYSGKKINPGDVIGAFTQKYIFNSDPTKVQYFNNGEITQGKKLTRPVTKVGQSWQNSMHNETNPLIGLGRTFGPALSAAFMYGMSKPLFIGGKQLLNPATREIGKTTLKNAVTGLGIGMFGAACISLLRSTPRALPISLRALKTHIITINMRSFWFSAIRIKNRTANTL